MMTTLRILTMTASVVGVIGVCGTAAVQMSASQTETATYSNPQPFKSRGDSTHQYRYLSDEQVKAYGVLEIVGFGGFGALVVLLVVTSFVRRREQI
jgi:hypothetical protein